MRSTREEEAVNPHQQGVVPVERSELGLIYVLADLKGQPVRMIVDTGANRTILDRAAADRLGIDSSGPRLEVAGCIADAASEAAAGALRLGPVAIPMDAVAVLDLSPMGPKLGERVDGIIGADVLAATAAVIDYGKGDLRISVPTMGT